MTPVNILLMSLILVITTYSELVRSQLLQSPPGTMQEAICEGSIFNIICSSNDVIDILSANFGRLSKTICNDGGNKAIRDLNCISGKSRNIVKAKCDNQQSCTLQPTIGVFGDPCAGTFKYLYVQYRCIPKGRIEPNTEKATACESTNLSIKCDQAQEIKILKANFGRQSPTVCNNNGKAVTRDVNCSAKNSEKIVKDSCERKENCNIAATNQVFGDPCAGTFKYLEIEYRCIPKGFVELKTEKVTACELTNLSIKCDRGYEIDILRANFGRQSPTVCNNNGKAVTRDVMCSAKNSEKIVKDSCEGKENCKIAATIQVFGDPCAGTFKYLEVSYTCKRSR